MRTVTIYKADYKGYESEQDEEFAHLLQQLGLLSFGEDRYEFTNLGLKTFPDVEEWEDIDEVEFRVDTDNILINQ